MLQVPPGYAPVGSMVGLVVDEWVEVDAPGWEGATGPLRAALAFRPEAPAPAPRIRALPTLQIHVTAGNAPVVAPASTLRLLATRSGGVVKLPAGSILPGAALAVALHAAADAHPAARPVLDALSLVYWRGGDAATEAATTPDAIGTTGNSAAVAAAREASSAAAVAPAAPAPAPVPAVKPPAA